MARKRPAVQCSRFIKKHNRRCLKFCAPGATVCYTHGGAAPQVKMAAARRTADAQATKIVQKYASELESLSNPFEALAQLAAFVMEKQKVLTQRVGDYRAADLNGPVAQAEERNLALCHKILVDMSRIDLDALRVKVTEGQQNQLRDLWLQAEALWVRELKSALPPDTHPTIDELTRTEFPRITRQVFSIAGNQPHTVTPNPEGTA